MVFTTRFAGGRGGRNGFEAELRRLGITQKNGKPSHPQTRVRTDRVDANGKLTLRAGGKLHHIGIGATHARTPVLMLVRDLHIRVINAATGELLRELTLDPARDYQPTGRPPGTSGSHPANR